MKGRPAAVPPASPPRRSCPICRRPDDARFRPFCSKRCADLDLGRWLTEEYRIPVETDADDDAAQEDEPSPEQR